MHVFYTGSGGAGKTSCLRPVAAEVGLTVKPSVVREFYAKHNISSQTDMSKMPEEIHSSFQYDLATFFIEKATEFCHNNENTIIDRSIFCHFAYFLEASPSAGWDLIMRFEQELIAKFLELNPVIVYFPYPPPWVLNNQTADGFRHVSPTKDLIMDAIIVRCITKIAVTRDNDIIYMPPTGTVEERTQYIVTKLNNRR